MSFVGKVAIVTGAGGGLGRHYVLELARRGCNVVVNDLGESASKVVQEIKSIPNSGKAISSQLSVLQGDEIVKQTIANFGRCDVLINNAGILRDKSFHKMMRSEWKSVIDVHLQGTFELCHAIWPHMQSQNYGRIVNVGSAAGLYGNFGQANYSAAKMGILGLTNTLAKEGAKSNILCNCIVPVADSAMTKTVLPPHLLDLLDPSHIAPFVALLAHESSTLNGSIFEVGGGWYSQVRWQRSQGVILGSKQSPATLESIQNSLKQICNFNEQPVYPTATADTLRDILKQFESYGTEAPSTFSQPKLSPSKSVLDSRTAPMAEYAEAKVLLSDKIFDTLARIMLTDKSKVESLCRDIDCSIQFHIKEKDSTNTKKWLLFLKASDIEKAVCQKVTSMDSRSDVLIRCADETFIDIVNQKLSPEYAYFRGLLEVKGNPIHINKVKGLLDYTGKLMKQ